MSLLKKTLLTILAFILLSLLISVVFRPVLSNLYVMAAKKSAKGQFICKINNSGNHEGCLYKIDKGKKVLIKKSESYNCIFSKPKGITGFFVLLIGGGGGATPYEKGSNAQIISKHKNISQNIITINVGKGGRGTYFEENKLVDAKDGSDSFIKDIDITAKGGLKSTRMTPLGNNRTEQTAQYQLPEKYRSLYDLQPSAKYGAGGSSAKSNKVKTTKSVKAQSGENGIVIIQW